MAKDGESRGYWTTAEEEAELIEPFDETFPHRSRSEMIKESMRLRMHVEERLEEVGFDDMSERDLRIWLGGLIRDEARRELERDD